MSEHVVAIVQARLGSTRFPRKVLADLAGQPLILHVLERAAAIPGVHTTIAAVPEGDTDLIDRLRALAVPIYAGPEHDVLQRVDLAAEAVSADVIVRITGDCPVLNPDVAAEVLALYADHGCAFASNDTTISGYPDGWDVEVFSRTALDAANRYATEPSDREHVTPWMRALDRVSTLYAPVRWTGPKLSVDTPADLETVRQYLEAHGAAR